MTDRELQELYDRYAHVIHHRCYGILKNHEDANDAVQETFAKVMKHADSFRQQSSPLTWMYRISTNHCLNQLRNRKGRADKLVTRKQDLVPQRPETEAAEDHTRILALLEGADNETRACVIHTYFDDCTRQETAKLVGLSVPTVRKRIQTFLDQARRQLGVVASSALVLLASFNWSLS